MKSVKVVVLLLVVIGLFSCSNDSTSNDNQDVPTYEEVGIVGDEGGIVHITDEESEIFGTFVEIPEGALNENVEISITQVEDFTIIDSTDIVIDFAPSGTQFSEPVEIGIPCNNVENPDQLLIYTYNEDKQYWETMPIVSYDASTNIATTMVTHFSWYKVGEYSSSYDVQLYTVDNNRLAMYIETPVLQIIPCNAATSIATGRFNMQQIFDYVSIHQFHSWYKIIIKEDTWFFPSELQFDWHYYGGDESTGISFKPIIVTKDDGEIYRSNTYINNSDDTVQQFFRGEAFVFISDPLPEDEDLRVDIIQYYSSSQDPILSDDFTNRYTENLGFSIENINLSELSDLPLALDENQNGITNSFDIPETDPVVEIITPSGVQSGYVTINYVITDDDGGMNEFGIYHQSNATGVQQAALISSSTGNIHNGSFIENIEPGSHSFVWDSNVVFNNENDNVKIIFSWVDPVNGGMLGLTFESDYFQVDNISPNITVTSPNGGETWQMGSSYNITWNDNISSNVMIDLYRSGTFETTITNPTISNGTYNWSIPTNLTESSSYKVKISSTSNSSLFDFSNSYFTIEEQDDTEPPYIGTVYIPAPGSTVSGIVTIETYATDNVGVTYVVFEVYRNGIGYEEVGIDYTPDANNHFSIEFNSELFEDGDHNIHATAYDVAQNFDMAGWSVNFDNNNPPNPPTNPIPVNNAIDVYINTDIFWSCTDPENDPLTYDIYFGTESDPPLVHSGQNETTYDPGILIEQTTYYWKIVAHDDHSNSTTGDIWQFITGIFVGTVTDIDGNVYQTVIIGNQEWIVENLKVTHYRNGDTIPHLIDNGDWSGTNSGAYCFYNNTPSNFDTYGNLYNWYAVNDSRGLAPEGWHIPTDEEIMQLEIELGMNENVANTTGFRGTNEGSKLAGNAALWNYGALETDPEFGSSGFDLLPGGRRTSSGSFAFIRDYGYFWSSTSSGNSSAWTRCVLHTRRDIARSDIINIHEGWSIRCVRD